MIPFLLKVVPFCCQFYHKKKKRQARLSPSGNSNSKLDIGSGLVGVMRGDKMGRAVGKGGIDVIRLGGESLQRCLMKKISVELERYLFNYKLIIPCK